MEQSRGLNFWNEWKLTFYCKFIHCLYCKYEVSAQNLPALRFTVTCCNLVISIMSGKFPRSKNIETFKKKMYPVLNMHENARVVLYK